MKTVSKTLGALLLLLLTLPLNLALTGVALIRVAFVRNPARVAQPARTILISGGKMTKALQLARSFHAAGHRVILVESGKYWLTGHRFSRAVDRFHTIPRPRSGDYVDALVAIVRSEGVDVYVPVCSPASSYYDALAKPVLSQFCEVLHCDLDMIRTVDDKYEFAARAAALGLSVPDTYRITSAAQVGDFDFAAAEHDYILKSIAYDPVNRMDLTTLPRPTPPETAAFARSKPISAANPWILQAMITGQEYCTHSTVREGRIQVFGCCESSAFQINYQMVDKPEIQEWVRKFVEPLKITGQVSFDFIEEKNGGLYAIECNPRTHSAITMFYDHPDVARAYLDDEFPMIKPLATSRPTYWIYHELWRLVTQPKNIRFRLAIIRRGKDAIFDWNDPLPFLMVHHAQLPWLLLNNLLHLRYWLRIDFNIGKLVEPAGD